MWEKPEGPVTQAAADRLFHAIRKALRAKHSPKLPVACHICHKLITLESNGICADENGEIAHTDCYVQHMIASRNPPAAQASS